jgi:hypothetical protein
MIKAPQAFLVVGVVEVLGGIPCRLALSKRFLESRPLFFACTIFERRIPFVSLRQRQPTYGGGNICHPNL